MASTQIGRWAMGVALTSVTLSACSAPTVGQLPGDTALAAARQVRGPWKTLQLHAHSKYGGGNQSVGELIQMAAKEGVDALVISDHNDWRQIQDPEFRSTERVTVIKGQEWGNVKRETPGAGDEPDKKGPHVGLLAPEGDAYIPPSTQVGNLLAEATARKATLVINHPKLPKHSWPEAVPDPRVHAAEIWNSWFNLLPGMFADIHNVETRSHLNYNQQALDWWDGLLKQGRKLTAVAGSDYHRWPQPFVSPINFAYAPTNSAAEHLAAVRQGRISLAHSPKGAQVFAFADDGSRRYQVMMGDTLHQARGRFRVDVKNAKGDVVLGISRKGIVWEQDVTAHTWSGTFEYAPAAGERDYLRFEVRPHRGDRDLHAMTNPIYLN